MDTEQAQPSEEQPTNSLDFSKFYDASSDNEEVVSQSESEDLSQQATEDEDVDADDIVDDENSEQTEDEESDTIDVYEIDGDEYTADQLKEFKKGYLRQSDYTKKTQEIAEERKQAQKLKDDYSDRLKRADISIDLAQNLLTEKFKGINWKELSREDPGEYLSLKEELDESQKQIDKAIAERDALVNQEQQDLMKKHSQEFAKRFPDLNKDTLSNWEQTIVKLGGDVNQANSVTDPFFWSLVNDANKWRMANDKDAIEGKRVKKVRKIAKSVKKSKPVEQPKRAADIFYGTN